MATKCKQLDVGNEAEENVANLNSKDIGLTSPQKNLTDNQLILLLVKIIYYGLLMLNT